MDASSGEQNRHRLSWAGHRRMNHIIHIAAISQIRLDTPGRAYFRRKLAGGKTKLEALRCLKRTISGAVYRQLLADAERAQLMSAGEPLGTGPGALRGDSRIQRGRHAPAHRHFGSATSRTRNPDATTASARAEDHQTEDRTGHRLTTKGAGMTRLPRIPTHDARWAAVPRGRPVRGPKRCSVGGSGYRRFGVFACRGGARRLETVWKM